MLLVLPACGGDAGRPAPPADAPRLVLLVTVDTLRADRLGAYGSDAGLTPHLDALAGDALVFDRAYAPASFTLPSVAGILTGRYPEELGIRDNESGIPAGVATLAGTLRDAGYRTGAVVSNFVLRAPSGTARGFERFDDEFTDQEATRGWPERPGDGTTDAALALLDELTAGDAPALLWVHYQDPHGPYTPPDDARAAQLPRHAETSRELPVRDDPLGLGGIPDYQLLDGRTDSAFYLAGYDAEVAAVDAAIGALLDGVGRRVPADDTVVLFTADHGEGLGEDDYWFAHGELLTDPLVNVPLMIAAPGVAPGRRTDVASLVDLAPTLLGLAGVPPPEGLVGRDLLAPGAASAPAFAYLATLGGARTPRVALVEGAHKFVVTLEDGAWRGALFERRPGEPERAVPAGETGRSMRRTLGVLQRRWRGAAETRQDLSEDELEALRALGYTGRGDR